MAISKPHSQEPLFFPFRSSKLFIYIVVNLAVFTDAYLYGLIIPVLPFALVERVNLQESEVQRWIGILLAAYGGGLIVGSRMSALVSNSLSGSVVHQILLGKDKLLNRVNRDANIVQRDT